MWPTPGAHATARSGARIGSGWGWPAVTQVDAQHLRSMLLAFINQSDTYVMCESAPHVFDVNDVEDDADGTLWLVLDETA